MKKLFILCLLLLHAIGFAQQVKILNIDHPEVSYRALDVVDNYILWVGGTHGTIGVSFNAGKSFQWVSPEKYKDRDFRAIKGINAKTAIAVAIDSPAIIIKTIDSGNNWQEVYVDEHPDVFLDTVHFYNNLTGIIIGDAIDGVPYILKTYDGGTTWIKLEHPELPDLIKGEAYFAASNSNVKMISDDLYLSVTGGSTSHLFVHSNKTSKVKLPKTASLTAGANGLDYSPKYNFGLIVGGDFAQSDDSENNLFIFELNEKQFPVIKTPEQAPDGYRSGVVILNENTAIVCGLSGVDISNDQGRNWKNISKTAFHACKKAEAGNKIYLVGPNGKIGSIWD